MKTQLLAFNVNDIHQSEKTSSYFSLGLVILVHVYIGSILANPKQTIAAKSIPLTISVSLYKTDNINKTDAAKVVPAEQRYQHPAKLKPKKNKTVKQFSKPAPTFAKQHIETLTPNQQTITKAPSNFDTNSQAGNAEHYDRSVASAINLNDQAPRFDANYLHNPPPKYPSVSRRLEEQGRVLLRVVVSPKGNAVSVVLQASSGSTRLDDAAIDAVKHWRFVPAKIDNKAVMASVVVPIRFTLGE